MATVQIALLTMATDMDAGTLATIIRMDASSAVMIAAEDGNA